jgi:hypothetical protein
MRQGCGRTSKENLKEIAAELLQCVCVWLRLAIQCPEHTPASARSQPTSIHAIMVGKGVSLRGPNGAAIMCALIKIWSDCNLGDTEKNSVFPYNVTNPRSPLDMKQARCLLSQMQMNPGTENKLVRLGTNTRLNHSTVALRLAQGDPDTVEVAQEDQQTH